MIKYNVKKVENTNTMTTTLTTSCKKRDTAISRFCRFLSEYDSCFKDSMLLCTMKIEFVGYVDSNVLYQATVETDEYNMTYTECGDVYHVIIEFKHNENTTSYKSLANTSVSNNTNDNETSTDSADGNNKTATDTKDTESDTNITYTLNNLKNRYAIKDDATDNCHYVYVKTWCKDDKKRVYINDYKNRTIGYIDAVNGDIKIDNRQGIYADELDYALINIIADMTNHITDNTESYNETSTDSADGNNKTATDNEVCTITPYENGKELTTPIQKMKCLTNVIDYVTRLYDMNIVTRETYFVISRVGKRDVVLTYTNTHIEKLSHLIDNIRFNTKKYRDKYFDRGDTK